MPGARQVEPVFEFGGVFGRKGRELKFAQVVKHIGLDQIGRWGHAYFILHEKDYCSPSKSHQ